MSNAAAGFDDCAETRQQEEEDVLHPAQHDDLSGKKAMEDGLLRAHQGYPSSKQAMEEGHVDGVREAQHGHLSSEKIMHEHYSDGVHMAQHDDSNNEKGTEEGFDDELQRVQLDNLSGKKDLQEGYGNGLHRAQHGDLTLEQTMEEGHHGDGKAEAVVSHEYASLSASISPQPEKATNAQTPHDSPVHANLADFGTDHNQCTTLHGEPGAEVNLTAWVTSGKQHSEKGTSAQESGDYVELNIGAHGRSREHSNAACMASFGTLGEHTHENGGDYGTLGGHVRKSTSAYGTSRQHAGGSIFANADFCTEEGQLGRYPHKATFANGNVGEYAQGSVYEDSAKTGDFRGNVYDFMTTNNEPDANAHERNAYNETGGHFKVDLSQNVTSMQAPSVMNYPDKSSELLAKSSYYTTQSGSMKNIGLVLRLGSAVFSLIAFSVIISTNEKRVAAGSTFYVKFSDYQAYNYLAALNLLSFLYSSGQLVLLAQAKSSSILASPLKWGASVYLCDQMLAFLMVSSSSSGATASELSRHGLRNIWPPACSTWKLSLFCSKADVAVGMSFISFLFTLMSSFSSAYHLSKLLAE